MILSGFFGELFYCLYDVKGKYSTDEDISDYRLRGVYWVQLCLLYAGEVSGYTVVNLDKLTYAGNLENLKGVEGDPQHVFVQGDICDKELVARLIAKYDPDYIINFAAESHVDRSIANPEIFVETNVVRDILPCQSTDAA